MNKLLKFSLADVHAVICVSHTSRENTVLRACVPPSRYGTCGTATLHILKALVGKSTQTCRCALDSWPESVGLHRDDGSAVARRKRTCSKGSIATSNAPHAESNSYINCQASRPTGSMSSLTPSSRASSPPTPPSGPRAASPSCACPGSCPGRESTSWRT